jgi:hypothetical protein
MAGRKFSDNERRAAAIVGSILGGTAVEHDVPGAGDAAYDFDVLLVGKHLALEVTSAANPAVLSTLAAAFGSGGFDAPSLANTWSIGIETTGGGPLPRIKDLVKQVVTLLEVFEQNKIERIDRRLYPPEAPLEVVNATVKLIDGLGASGAHVWPVPGDPKIYFQGHGGFNTDGERLNVLAVTAAESNAAKLLAANVDERHLFLWVTATEPEVEMAMGLGQIPPTPPVLPAGVDVVWAQNETNDLWRVRPPGDWELLESPA